MPLDTPNPLESLTPDAYQELHRIASNHFRQQLPTHTLQPTAIVHEAFVKLAEQTQVSVNDAQHFRVLASKVMRQILIDHARSKSTAKRGGEWKKVTMVDVTGDPVGEPIDLILLDEVLAELESLDARKARLVELRFFSGLTEAEAAEALQLSRSETSRQWRTTRAWLNHRMRAGASDEEAEAEF